MYVYVLGQGAYVSMILGQSAYVILFRLECLCDFGSESLYVD
jgi:hypothetical protein